MKLSSLRGSIVVLVKPNKRKNRIVGFNTKNELVVEIAAPPIENKANLALIELFKQQGLNVRIVSGLKSRRKRLEII